MNAASSFVDPRITSPLSAVVALAMAGAAFFSHPLGLLLLVCLLAVVTPTSDFKWLFLVSACALFMTLNVSRLVDGDLVLYVRVQEYLAERPLYALFDKEELQLLSGTYRVTEAGFYAPLWLMSFVIPDAKTAIAVAATLGIYVPTFLGVALIGKAENWSKGAILTTALFAFFAGINFVQSTHLIRQYISTAFLFYAFALFISKRNRWAVVVALGACTIHNGTAPLTLMLAGVCWLFRYREGPGMRLGGFIIRAVCAFVVICSLTLVIPIVQGEFYKEDVPNIHIGHFIVVGVFLLIAQIAIQMQHLRLRSLYYARLISLVIFIVSLAFFLAGMSIFALRYFAYLEWLYGLMVGGVMFAMFRIRPALQVFSRFAVSLAAGAIFLVRVNASEWQYGPGNNNLLSWDFFQVADLVDR
jgi:hypothetical protein